MPQLEDRGEEEAGVVVTVDGRVSVQSFRSYGEHDLAGDPVREHYQMMREKQSLVYHRRVVAKYTQFSRKMTVKQAMDLLDGFVDISDPDMTLANSHHLFQTAEAIRADGHPDWLQLTGLIHDLGKVMYAWGCDADGTSIAQQWGLVGDTFVLGHGPLPKSLPFPEFNGRAPVENAGYAKNCGLDNVAVSWGHDEYLYQVLTHHTGVSLPPQALYIIRFHSCYAHHQDNAYDDLLSQQDRDMLTWLKLFQKYDLYSKEDKPVVQDLWPYYEQLIKKYLGDTEIMF